jgi:hypothetical protein
MLGKDPAEDTPRERLPQSTITKLTPLQAARPCCSLAVDKPSTLPYVLTLRTRPNSSLFLGVGDSTNLPHYLLLLFFEKENFPVSSGC